MGAIICSLAHITIFVAFCKTFRPYFSVISRQRKPKKPNESRIRFSKIQFPEIPRKFDREKSQKMDKPESKQGGKNTLFYYSRGTSIIRNFEFSIASKWIVFSRLIPTPSRLERSIPPKLIFPSITSTYTPFLRFLRW